MFTPKEFEIIHNQRKSRKRALYIFSASSVVLIGVMVFSIFYFTSKDLQTALAGNSSSQNSQTASNKDEFSDKDDLQRQKEPTKMDLLQTDYDVYIDQVEENLNKIEEVDANSFSEENLGY